MQTYPIVEIFHSTQGEGFHVGMPHVFVRFGNCNLRCEWCDTDFLQFEEMEIDEIVEKVLSYNCDRVIFTGGEPAMQDLSTIGKRLKQHDITLSIETNGTIEVDPIIDWICVSPKAHTELVLTTGSELKLVYPQNGAAPERYQDLEFQHRFLQPLDGPNLDRNTSAAIAYCLENPNWCLSLQTHKITGIR